MIEKSNGDGDGDGDDQELTSTTGHSLTHNQQSSPQEPELERTLMPLVFEGFNPHSSGPIVPDLYFYQSFPDANLSVPMNMSSYPYSLSESGSSIDILALQHNLLELDVLNQLTARDELPCTSPHEYPPCIPDSQPQPSPQHYSPPPDRSQSPEINPKKVSFPIIASAAQTNGYAHTMLPPMIHPNPANPTMQFDSEVRRFPNFLFAVFTCLLDPYIQSTRREP